MLYSINTLIRVIIHAMTHVVNMSDRYGVLHVDFSSDEALTNQEIVDDGLKSLSNFLRPYQVDACRYTITRILKTTEPILLTLPTGAGKSWIIVGISFLLRRLIHKDTGKRKKVVMICPTPDLAEQNYEKLIEAGFTASIFSASLKSKDTSDDIIIGTPVTIVNSKHIFEELEIAAVIIDEAHKHTDSHKKSINAIKAKNPNLREIGLTATPYRQREGYIFSKDTFNKNFVLTRQYAKNPYYAERVFDVSVNKLIEEGYLTPLQFEPTRTNYDISNLKLKKSGDGFTAESEREVFINGKYQLTQKIIDEVRAKTANRRSVLIFAQNIEHATLLKDYFSDDECGITHSELEDEQRKTSIADFKSGRKKYLINVQSLTTGFDAPACDAIVILRSTVSYALFMQILGRGMRLTNVEGHVKHDCLVLDYASNLLKHCPSGDPFDDDELRVFFSDEFGFDTNEYVIKDVICPRCKHENMFRSITLPLGVTINQHGHMLHEETGTVICTRGAKPFPISATMGIRCAAYHLNSETNKRERCKHHWSYKVCDVCAKINHPHSVMCKHCHSPLSKKIADVNNEDIRALSLLQKKYKHERLCAVLEARWNIEMDKHTSRISVCLQLKVQELPYLKGYLQWSVEAPKPNKVKIWLSPRINTPFANEQWAVFCDYFFGQHLQDVGDTVKIQPKIVNFILLKAIRVDNRNTHQILKI